MTPENRPGGRGSLFALALIVTGSLLFLDNLGIVSIEQIGAWWPIGFIVYGLGLLYNKRNPATLVWSGMLMAAGVLLILGNLHILRMTFALLWPLLLIAAGALMLVGRANWETHMRERRTRWQAWQEQHGEEWQERLGQKHWKRYERRGFDKFNFTGSRVHEVAVFFSAKRRVETQDFQRGQLVAVFGSIEVDFRDAQIQLVPTPSSGGSPVRRAVLEATAVFGSVDIAVPRTWRVMKEGAGVFGSYEDKTVPARNEPGVEPTILVVRGGAVFGSVTITN